MPEKTYFEDGERPDIPEGYEFFSVGDPYLTRKVKTICGQEGITVYTQLRKRGSHTNPVGYHAPSDIVAKAKQLRDATAGKRGAKKANRLVLKNSVIESARNYLMVLGKDQQLAEAMLNSEGVAELYELLKACNGDRTVAKRIVKMIQQAQL